MSNKKSLLTESEIRRFMKLANIPAIGKELVKEESEAINRIQGDTEATSAVLPRSEGYTAGMEEEDQMPELDDAGGEEETMKLGDEAAEGAGEEVSDELAMKVAKAVLSALGKESEFSVEEEPEAAAPEQEPSEEEGEEGEEASEEGEEEGEEELDEAEEVEESEKLEESKLIETILARVTARLIAEAKKSKMSAAEKKKKAEEAKKKKEMMKKKAAAAKNKLEEANAPAPKSTMPNASAAGVAKGHGPGSKAFGTDEKKSMKWKQGKGEKGHELQTVSASAEHIVSHGKKNLAVQGGNKKG